MTIHQSTPSDGEAAGMTLEELQVTDQRKAFLEAERAKWLVVAEAAFVLKTTPKIIYRMLRQDVLPHRREGKTIRIHLDDLRPHSDGQTQNRR